MQDFNQAIQSIGRQIGIRGKKVREKKPFNTDIRGKFVKRSLRLLNSSANVTKEAWLLGSLHNLVMVGDILILGSPFFVDRIFPFCFLFRRKRKIDPLLATSLRLSD